MKRIVALGLLAAALVIVACPTETKTDHRGAVVVGAAFIAIDDLTEAHDKAAALTQALDGFCAAPDAATLDAAQQAWWDLRAPWKRLLAMPFGPLVDDGFDTAIDFWPARVTSIEGGLAAAPAEQADLDVLGVASKGLPSIEYFLWDPVNGDSAVLALYGAPEGAARCAHVELLAADVALRIDELIAAWDITAYAGQLMDAGSSEEFPTLALAIDTLLNAMIAGLHDLDEKKLTKPLGELIGAPQPDLLESRFSDRSLLDARDALEGFRRMYLGHDGHPGMTLVVAGESETVDQRVRDALAAAEQALANVPEPLSTAIVDDRESVAAAEQAIHDLRIVLTAEVASLLGVTVSLSDNDGD